MDLLANSMVVIILRYVCQIIIVYTLNLHNVLCRLYLKKPGKKNTLVEYKYMCDSIHVWITQKSFLPAKAEEKEKTKQYIILRVLLRRGLWRMVAEGENILVIETIFSVPFHT